jgi:alkanesulfonate monooxygenase SsuD/methylene tetrahydromethanopterin reductase-like flavin-dependent oxidoreductase (luciferase family)
MELGMFLMTGHRPEQAFEPGGYKRGFEWDLEMIKAADRLGFKEAWVGEHFTNPWEPLPAPDLLIQSALRETKNIILAPGAHLPAFHHPTELAARIAYQDQLFEGRYMVGIGSGGVPSDAQMFNVDAAAGENRAMAREGLEIMVKYWTEPGPWRYEGKYWTVERVDADSFPLVPGALGDHLTPYQHPHPPIGVAGLSPNSPTLEWAGEMGYLPLSLNMNNRFMAGHWDSYQRGAAKTGLTPDRSKWRIVREVFVADTDDEAFELARDGFLGQYYSEFMLPIFGFLDFAQYWKHDDSVPDSALDLEYLVEHQFLVGSVDTVVQKLKTMDAESGGFGTLLMLGLDYADQSDAWMRSMQLMAEEVMPQLP